MAAGWEAEYLFEFQKMDGTSVDVRVDGHFEVWTEGTGNGDWRIRGDLFAFLDELFAETDGETATGPAE